jgi:hypothetical protein
MNTMRNILAMALLLSPAMGVSAQDPTIPTGDAIASCTVDPAPARTGGSDAPQITCETVLAFLTQAKVVSKDVWLHNYSHVALADHTGRMTLREGGTVRWLIRPGGLGTLTFPDGKELFLVRCCGK